MSMNDVMKCAVSKCGRPLANKDANLCANHVVPGYAVRVGDSSMVITNWAARHEVEFGIIRLNDFALGDCFGGQEGFERRLQEQGFTHILLLKNEAEIRFFADTHNANWSGPWQVSYPWQGDAADDPTNPSS